MASTRTFVRFAQQTTELFAKQDCFGETPKPTHETRALPYNPGVAREFGVGRARTSEEELVGADGAGCEKIVGAGCTDDVVLIDTIAADADCADELTVAI